MAHYKKINMKKLLTIIIVFATGLLNAQTDNKTKIWTDSILKNRNFEKVNISSLKLKNLDKIVSCENRFENDPKLFYSGIFGESYKRIDFYLSATFANDSLNLLSVSGFDRLGKNIRPLSGYMRVSDVLKYRETYGDGKVYLVILDCKLYESGTNDLDGYFTGIYTLVLISNETGYDWFYSESGDFREFGNVFIGNWRNYNSNILKSTLFSYRPIGLYSELPLSAEFYKHGENEDYVLPKDKYVSNGWKDFTEDLKNNNELLKNKWWVTK